MFINILDFIVIPRKKRGVKIKDKRKNLKKNLRRLSKRHP